MIWRSMTPLALSAHWIVRGSRNAQPCFPLTEIGRRGPKSPLDIPLVHRPSQKRRDILTPPLPVAVGRGRSPTRPPSLPMLSAWELIGFFLIRKTRGDRASVKGRTRGESEKEREREAAPSGLGHTYAYVLRTTQIHGTNAAPRRGCPSPCGAVVPGAAQPRPTCSGERAPRIAMHATRHSDGIHHRTCTVLLLSFAAD